MCESFRPRFGDSRASAAQSVTKAGTPLSIHPAYWVLFVLAYSRISENLPAMSAGEFQTCRVCPAFRGRKTSRLLVVRGNAAHSVRGYLSATQMAVKMPVFSVRAVSVPLHPPHVLFRSSLSVALSHLNNQFSLSGKVIMKLAQFVLPFGRSRLVRSGNLPSIVIRASGCAAVGLFCFLSAFGAW
jgi:hypothetical protein